MKSKKNNKNNSIDTSKLIEAIQENNFNFNNPKKFSSPKPPVTLSKRLYKYERKTNFIRDKSTNNIVYYNGNILNNTPSSDPMVINVNIFNIGFNLIYMKECIPLYLDIIVDTLDEFTTNVKKANYINILDYIYWFINNQNILNCHKYKVLPIILKYFNIPNDNISNIKEFNTIEESK